MIRASSLSGYQLYIDGASRGNPGPAGVGIYFCHASKPLIAQGYFIGVATNNVAEYSALLIGLELIANQMGKIPDGLQVISDSQLLIRQMQKIYQIKNENLIILKNKIDQFLVGSKNIHFKHVLREQNTKADALANQGIDQKKLY